MRLNRVIYVAFIFLFALTLNSQVTIADALPGCLNITDSDGENCIGASAAIFQVVGTQFVANNSDGSDCNCPQDYGNNTAYFEFETVNISSFMNVSINFSYSADVANYEDDVPSAPLTGCAVPNSINNSHDQIVFYYSINGGPFILGEYIHGTNAADFTGTWIENGLNGNTLTIRVIASNKDDAETFYFENLLIEGDPKPINAGPDDSSCGTDPVNLTGTGVGTWSGGSGTFGNPNLPNTTYTPAASEVGSTVTLTYAANPATPGCAGTYPPPSDDVDITFIAAPEASISGGGDLCQGECTTVNLTVVGGVEPFSVSFTANGFPFPNIPGFSFNDVITVCLLESNFPPIPTYDSGSNTLEIPGGFTGNTLTFQFTGISDNSGCPGTVDGTPVEINLLEKPQASDATLEKCDEGGGQATFELSDALFDIIGTENGIVHFYSDIDLTVEEFSPYVSGSGTLYAVIEGDNGCWSEPSILNLEVLPPGDVSPVSITCNGLPNCKVCDDDGIAGEEVTFQINLPTAQNYAIEINYLIGGVPGSFIQNVNGIVDDINFTITDDAIFTLSSVTVDGECPDLTGLGPNVTIEYNVKPTIVNPPTLSSCDDITLPPLDIINPGPNTGYYTGTGGSGTMYNIGDVITSTLVLYGYSGTPDCFDEEVILVNIGGNTSFTPPRDVSICGGYVLPEIDGTNVSSTASYFTQVDGAGMEYQVGDTVKSSTMLYVFDSSNIGCSTNQPAFQVTISPSPSLIMENIIKSCDTLKLPVITGTNLTGNEAYFSNPLFTGLPDSIGTLVTQNDTFYIYAGTSICNDKDTVIIQIQSQTTFDEPQDVNACNSYELPQITGLNIGVNAGYFTDTTETAIQYNVGDIITNPLRLFVYDTTSFCQNNIPEFNIVVTPGPEIFSINDTAECDYFILPVITGVNLTGSQAYYDEINGGGQQYNAGDTIFSSQQIFAFEANPACATQQPFQVTVDTKPLAGNPLIVQICLEQQITFNLFNLLTGSYDTDGVWTLINSNSLDISDPTAVVLPDTLSTNLYRFRYAVDGGACNAAVSLPNAVIIQNPSAGLDSIYQVCQGSSGAVNLFDLLRNESSNAGTWTSTNLLPDPTNVDISSYALGDYTFKYGITNTFAPTNSSCNDTSQVTIRVVTGLNAGNDVNVGQICEGSDVDLTSLINNSTNIGTFKTKSNNLTISNPNTYTIPNGVNNNLIIQHIIPSSGGCNADTSEIRFTVVAKPNAGDDVLEYFCGTQTINLESLLINADAGGNFIGINNNLTITNNTISPSDDGIFSFQYYFETSSLCPGDTVDLSVDYIETPSFEVKVNQFICLTDDIILGPLEIIQEFTSTKDNKINVSFVHDSLYQLGIKTGISYSQVNVTDSLNRIYFLQIDQLQIGKYHVFLNNYEAFPCEMNDSIYAGSFEVLGNQEININNQYCINDSVVLYGTTFNKNNNRDTITINSPIGCDTIVYIDLEFIESSSDTSINICEGKSISFNNTNFDSNSNGGQVILQNQSSTGCDSTINVSVNKLLNNTNSYAYTTCNENYSIQFGNNTFDFANPVGNALLGISAANGCDSIVNVTLTFSAPESMLEITNALCEDDLGKVTITESDLNGDIDLLIDGIQTTTFNTFPYEFELSQGLHSIALKDIDDCETESEITISIDEAPEVNIREVTQNDGSKRLIIESDVPLTNIQWTPPTSVDCDDCEDVLVLEYGAISVLYEFGVGCVDTLNYSVFENVKEEIYFPNIFNTGGINNTFYPQKSDGYLVKALSMSIFDRWGNKVFHNENFEIGLKEEGWNGKLNGNRLNPGVYVFTLQVEDANGNTKYFTGDVTLVE